MYDFHAEIADAQADAERYYHDNAPTVAEAEADYELDCAELLFEVMAGKTTLIDFPFIAFDDADEPF